MKKNFSLIIKNKNIYRYNVMKSKLFGRIFPISFVSLILQTLGIERFGFLLFFPQHIPFVLPISLYLFYVCVSLFISEDEVWENWSFYEGLLCYTRLNPHVKPLRRKKQRNYFLIFRPELLKLHNKKMPMAWTSGRKEFLFRINIFFLIILC